MCGCLVGNKKNSKDINMLTLLHSMLIMIMNSVDLGIFCSIAFSCIPVSSSVAFYCDIFMFFYRVKCLIGMSGAKSNHFCAEESNDVGKRRPFYVSVQAESLSLSLIGV